MSKFIPENITLKQLAQDRVSMDMSILDTINEEVVNGDNIIRHLMLGTLLQKDQKFTLKMHKRLFRRISSSNNPHCLDIDLININDVFTYTVRTIDESDFLFVKFTKL